MPTPEHIVREALIQAAMATLREEGCPETYVAQRAHEVLDKNLKLDQLAQQTLDEVRTAFGYRPLGIIGYDGGRLLELFR